MEPKKYKVFLTAGELAHIQYCLDYVNKHDSYHGRLNKHRDRIRDELTAVLQTTNSEEE